jgi:two-component system cell cycle sensor histidine kinase/response regulator CckA
MTAPGKRPNLAHESLRLALIYAGWGVAWIVITDGLVAWWGGEGGFTWLTNSGKGLLFVGATSALLYLLCRRLLDRHLVAERALEDSRERLALSLESTAQGLYEIDLPTGQVVWNPAYPRIPGHDPAGYRETFDSALSRVHPDDREQLLKCYQDYVEGRTERYRTEFRMATADGDWRWILSLGRVVERDAQGRPSRFLGTHTDITERKAAEARVADALGFARAVIHSSPLGIIAYGPEGGCVTANESAAQIVGTDVPGLLRQNFRQLDSWRRSGLLAVAEAAGESGAPQVFRGALHTSFGRHLWIEAELVPFRYADQHHLLLLLADRTIEQAAQDNLRLLHAAVQAAPSAWVITDATGRVEWVNPAFSRLTGYGVGEVVGQNPRLLRSGRHGPEFYQQMWATIRRGEVWSGEICNRRKDGTLYDEHMTIAPVRGADGAIEHYVAIKDDITANRLLQQQLTRTQRLESIGMLASGIAHDLNNVLTPILLSIELLRAKYPGRDGEQHIQTVASAATRGAGIVRQVLTFARGLDTGERADVQPRYLLKELARLAEETFPRNIEVQCEIARDVRMVRGDITQLHQVLLNLAVNARDAMPQGGTLTLSARNHHLAAPDPVHPEQPPGDYVVLAVTDSGSGMPPEVIEHLFEPFYTTKARGKGTGLGLSTAYGIVRSHGGVIDVRTNLGQGSTFAIRLPAVTAASRPPQAPAQPASACNGDGRRVLVVDDEESIRALTAMILRKHGFVPEGAADGREGLDKFEADPAGFAAAIIDMMMPRMNGTELVRAIRARHPRFPILLSTGLISAGADPSVEEELRAAGVRNFLHKPYGEPDLIRALGEELGQLPRRG